MSKTQNIINKGVHCKIRVYGSGLVTGKNYTAVLYYNARKEDYRATTTADAFTVTTEQDGVTTETATCIFDFTPEQTATLKTGNVILEVYDTDTLQQMKYDDAFATVRSTSLNA